MTNMQQHEKTTQKPGQSIGFLRAAEKMQIATFEIPLTFLEDLGFSKDRIQAAKYMNRRFITGFYDRVRRIGERMSFSGGRKGATAKPAQVRKAETEAPAKPAKAATATKSTTAAEPTEGKAKAQAKSGKPEKKTPSE